VHFRGQGLERCKNGALLVHHARNLEEAEPTKTNRLQFWSETKTVTFHTPKYFKILESTSKYSEASIHLIGRFVDSHAGERFRMETFEPLGNWREGFATSKGPLRADRVGTREPTRDAGRIPSSGFPF
jgi:hypothetical protein